MNFIVLRRLALIVLSVLCVFASVAGLVRTSQRIYAESVPVFSPVQEEETVVRLPVMLSDSCVVAERLVAYSGTFVEDGTDREVENVAALRIYNAGEEMLPFFRITLVIQGKLLQFEGSCLPSGSAMLLQEMYATTYVPGEISSVMIRVYDGSCWDYDGELIAWETYMGGIKLHNLSQQTLHEVYIYHKNYLAEQNLYLGGATYITFVPDLEAGEKRNVWPARWCEENKIIAISIRKDTP